MLFFAQLESAAESGSQAAAEALSVPVRPRTARRGVKGVSLHGAVRCAQVTAVESRLPLATQAAALLPECAERLLGYACALIAMGLCASGNCRAGSGGGGGGAGGMIPAALGGGGLGGGRMSVGGARGGAARSRPSMSVLRSSLAALHEAGRLSRHLRGTCEALARHLRGVGGAR